MKFDLLEVVLIWIVGISIGAYLTGLGMRDDIGNNTVNGYHCQPIQKAEALEEAKARIEQYQAMVRG